jgi:small subunit ribosomal protein S8
MNSKFIDFVTRIKNASLARRREIVLPYSKLNREIGKVLVKLGFLEEIKEDKDKVNLLATLKFDKRTPMISGTLIFSKPSLRIYESSKKLEKLERKGNKTIIISTSQGVMTGKEARKKGLGGEVLFAIW